MLLLLHLCGRSARRALAAFALLEAGFALLSLLQLAHREPLLASWALTSLAPVLLGYSAVPCALGAVAIGAGSALASAARDGELTAAAASGLRPAVFLLAAAMAGAAATPFTIFAAGELFPGARAAVHVQRRLLLRAPDVCLRLLASDPRMVPGLALGFTPEDEGRLRDLWAVELEDGLPAAVISAQRGEIAMPPARDVVRLELTGVELWQAGAAGVRHSTADSLRLDRAVGSLSERAPTSARAEVRESSFAELDRLIAELPAGEVRDRARAERAGRWCLALAPLPLALAAGWLGLALGRGGAWAGGLGGAVLSGLVLLPAHSACTRIVAEGGGAAVLALPPALCLLLAAGARRIRGGRP